MVAEKPLKVQLIAKREAGISGTSRYTGEIHRGLFDAGVNVQLTFPAAPPLPRPLIEALKRLGLDVATFFAACPVRARLEPADLYHIPTQTMATLLCFQRFPRPVVVTVLDIIPHLVRGDDHLDTSRHAVERLFFRLAMAGLKRADALISISEYTKNTLVKALGVPAERIHVVHPAVDQGRFHPLDVSDAFRDKYGLDPGWRYILNVGSDDPRKNLPALLHALAIVKEECANVRLMQVGSSQFPGECRRLMELVETLGLEEHVLLLGRVPDEELPLFYNLADVLAMPSLYEGFGLPVAEAMACGTPVVCSDETSLPEVGGPAARYVPTHSPDALAYALLQVLTDHSLADELRRKGLIQAANFALGRMTDGVMKAYASAFKAGTQFARGDY